MTALLVTSRSFSTGSRDVETEALALGYVISRGPSHHDLEQLRPLLATTEAWIAGTGPISSEHLDAAPQLRVIARYGVGTEALDVAEARRRGVVVTNTPGANSEAVADIAIALMLSRLRGLRSAEDALRSRDWGATLGRELGSLTVGCIGFGRVGQGVARRAHGFGAKTIAYDPYLDIGAVSSHTAASTTIDEVFASADIVSLHAPGGQVVVSASRLALMKPDALIINTARADLVDEPAVVNALRSGKLAGYAADMVQGDTAAQLSPLLAPDLADRVTLTPHIGAQTIQAIDNMGSMAFDNVHAVLTGQAPPNPVPFAEK